MRFVPQDELLERMVELKREGVPFVVATVIGTRGSTPRKVGAKMVVTQDGRTFGTIGGGAIEAKIIEKAKELLKRPEVLRLEWDLAGDENLGMWCGGTMEFLLEPFGVRPQAFIFGAGHVGQALNSVLNFIGFEVTVVDHRSEMLTTDRLPQAKLVCDHPASAAAKMDIPEDAFCVVATPAHAYDFETMRALVFRPLRYLGLMASKRKRKEIFEALKAEGVSDDTLAMVRCPVGLDIGAESPEEIAISIAAEMISVIRGRGGGR